MHAALPQQAEQEAGSSDAGSSKTSRDLRRVDIHPDHWYPLAWSREVKRGKTHGVFFAGDPIVLVRTESGRVFALEDRCAHRQVPLHAGVVDGESIRCCYHGWTYDCTGRCTDVPYLGRERLPNGVRSYPCREEAGLIFVFPGDPLLADTAKFPELGSATDKAYKTRRFGRAVKCHYSFMHENLMDMNHQFLHRRQMGQHARALARAPARRRLGRSGLHVRARGGQAADRRGAGLRPEARHEARRLPQGRHDDPHRSIRTRRSRSARRTRRW